MMSWRVAFLAFGILLFGVGAPALRDAANGGSAGYLAMAIGVALVIAIGMLGCWWMLRRTRPVPRDVVEAPSHSLRQQFEVAWHTRAFRLLLMAFVIQALATGAMLAAAQYFATYVMDQEGLSDVLFAALIVPALVVMPLWARVGHRRGKRVGYLVSSLVFLGGALTLLVAPLVPTGAVLAMVALCGIGYAGMQMFPLAMLPDTIAVDSASLGSAACGLVHRGLDRRGDDRLRRGPRPRPAHAGRHGLRVVVGRKCRAARLRRDRCAARLLGPAGSARGGEPAPHPPVPAGSDHPLPGRHAMSIPRDGREHRCCPRRPGLPAQRGCSRPRGTRARVRVRLRCARARRGGPAGTRRPSER